MKTASRILLFSFMLNAAFIFVQNAKADGEGFFEMKDCVTNCKNGTCTERKSAEDPKDGIVYDCKASSGQGGTKLPIEQGGSVPTSPQQPTSPTTSPLIAPATPKISTGACEAGFTKISGVCVPGNTGLPGQSVDVIVKNFLFWLLSIFATIATIAFLISGVQYLVASGDQKIMETAKRNMTYSIIGILIGLSGLIILRAVEALLGARAII